jgi:D-apionate oxidoisomerase
MSRIALFGAGGKIGCRITDRLKESSHSVFYVEPGPAGRANLERRGLPVTSEDAAVGGADIAVLAVPDSLLQRVSAAIAPRLRPGAMVVCLDPAAPCAGRVTLREDLSCFVTHPCHPPVFNDETDPGARRDFFGGVRARQHIVCALLQGPEEDYARGEALAREMFAPVMRAHRVTVEQMAILEPALSETTSQTCIQVIREALDEAVRRGVPADAARDFLLGHINIQLAIFFGEIDVQFSDGAKLAMSRARSQIIQPDWKQVFEPNAIRECLEAITQPGTAAPSK